MSLAAVMVAMLPAAGGAARTAAIPMIWRIERHAPDGSGAISCLIVSWGRDVTARLHKERGTTVAKWSVRVGHDNEPASVRYLRIERKIYTTDRNAFDGREAEEIVALLKAPGEFAFEWAERPDFAKRLGLFDTGDFAAKAAECERWIGDIRV